MNLDIAKNILLLFVIIFLFLLISNDKKYNEYLRKNKINYLVLLILIYFIYVEMPLSIIVIFLLIVLILNKNFYYNYLKQNKYLKNYLPHIETFINDDKNNLENFDLSPIKKVTDENSNDSEINIQEEKSEKKINEPFKSKVQTIKKYLNNAINNIN